MAPTQSHVAWEWWLEEGGSVKYGERQLESMLGKKRSAHQSYSWLQIAKEWIIVMWDTGCSLPGLITIETVGKWIAVAPQALQYHHTYTVPRPINGINADGPVLMVGVVVFRREHRGRAIDLEFGVLKGGDSGAACAIIGNYALRKDKYDGLVDVKAGKAVLRTWTSGRGGAWPFQSRASLLGARRC
jgi:hypothetical protein